jgi:predicted Fe-S protein YdhL (DUF1289 family)
MIEPPEQDPGQLARGHDRVIEVGGDADPGELLRDIVGAAGGVGEQHDAPPALPQEAQRLGYARKGREAVMQHPPYVDQEAVIALDQRADPFTDRNAGEAIDHGGRFGHQRCTSWTPLQTNLSDMTVPSPCIKVCVLDADRRACVGCGRTLDEIATWSTMSDDGRRRVLRAAAARVRARHDADEPVRTR